MNLQPGSWYLEADTEIYFTTTMLLWKETYLVEDYSKYLNEVYGFHTFRKTSISHPARMCVCLLYTAVPSGELENWVVSPSQIASHFVMVSWLWLAVSDLHSALMMFLCSHSEAAQNHACRVLGVKNFKIWPQCYGLVLFRFKRHVENGKSTYGEQSTW